MGCEEIMSVTYIETVQDMGGGGGKVWSQRYNLKLSKVSGWGSLVDLLVKNPHAMQDTSV